MLFDEEGRAHSAVDAVFSGMRTDADGGGSGGAGEAEQEHPAARPTSREASTRVRSTPRGSGSRPTTTTRLSVVADVLGPAGADRQPGAEAGAAEPQQRHGDVHDQQAFAETRDGGLRFGQAAQGGAVRSSSTYSPGRSSAGPPPPASTATSKRAKLILDAGIHASIDTAGDALDNALVESRSASAKRSWSIPASHGAASPIMTPDTSLNRRLKSTHRASANPRVPQLLSVVTLLLADARRVSETRSGEWTSLGKVGQGGLA